MSDLPVVAIRLKEARLVARLSQKQLGMQAGMDPSIASARVNHYERGRHVPDLLTVQRLAKVLGVPAPYLYAADDDLARWILAYDRVTSSERKAIMRKANPKGTRAKSSSR